MESEPKRKPRGAKKKAETIRKRQAAQKKELLEILEESPNIGAALLHAKINRSTFSRWRASDQKFSLDAKNAIAEGIERTADNVELSLLNVARNGDVRAQKYYLDHNHERYMRRPEESPSYSPLTEERKAEIAQTMRLWSLPDDSDERDEDYESPYSPEDKDSDENEDTLSDKELK